MTADMSYSARELAKLTGVSDRTIRRHEAAGVICRGENGRFLLPEVIPQLVRDAHRRLRICEHLLRKFLPAGELQAWYDGLLNQERRK